MAINWESVKRVLAGRRIAHRNLVLAAGIVISLTILGSMILSHVGGLLPVAERLKWGYFWVALGASMASYLMVGLALWEVLRLLGHRLTFAEVFGIGFVSNTANYFVSSAGVSGFALKAHLLHKRGVPYGTTVTASVVTSAILYFVLAAIILQGLVYLVLRVKGAHIQVMESAVGMTILLATALVMLKLFFDREIRDRLSRAAFRLINHGAYLFSASEIPQEDFDRFMEQLEKGLGFIRTEKGRLTRAIAYTCLDWGFCMLTLYYGFKAVGQQVVLGHLSTGFAVGQATTLIPLLPGGLGAMEAGMAAVYEGLGIPWESAVVASLIFRIAYYVVPGLLSFFLLWGLKVSEPALVEETVEDILPEELKLMADDLEKKLEKRRWKNIKSEPSA
ncbi:MAG: flippase-like domain-containing protein [Elusimicrobia bacterium]|nr:flippase-like domain-containing protein [Elusimicrobiota bacterium]